MNANDINGADKPKLNGLDGVVRPFVSGVVTSCMWLLDNGNTGLAVSMRNDFVEGWGLPQQGWNELLDEMRGAGSPESQVASLRYTLVDV